MSLDQLTQTDLDTHNTERLDAVERALLDWSEVLPPEDEPPPPQRASVLDWILACVLGGCLYFALVSWAGEPDPNPTQVSRVTT
jgi:hypothetical protein